jgi:lipid-A-disaccharide synthase-like uncharacterized protein
MEYGMVRGIKAALETRRIKEDVMRRKLYLTGWAILFMLPLAFTTEILLRQDLPAVAPWKWALLVGVVLLVFVSRNRDEVFKHHVV